MAKKTPIIRVPCPEIDRIVFLKKLSEPEQKVIFEKLQKEVDKLTQDSSLYEYIRILIVHVLHNPKFLRSVTDKEEIKLHLSAIYKTIVEIYPVFRIEIICGGLNVSPEAPPRIDDSPFFADLQIYEALLEEARQVVDRPRKKIAKKALFNLSQIINIKTFLKSRVVGQDQAIDVITDYLKLMASGMVKKSSFFFIGPTGVGKTQVARLLGELYSGNFFMVNCAEYSGGHEYAKLIGSPPGYIGHTEKSLLKEKADKSNRWVFLFDEIEKAHDKFFNFLLALLDTGTVQDNLGNVLDFSESIFIFTSNQGVSEIKEASLGFTNKTHDYSGSKDDVMKSIKRLFSPEFRNRIDEFVFFNSLTEEDVKKIVSLQLEALPIKKLPELVTYIVKHAYSPEYGAREIERFIRKNVALPIADVKLSNRIAMDGGLYTPRIIKDKVEIIDTIEYLA